MSTETDSPPKPALPPLPEPTITTGVETYDVPHILIETKDGVDSIRRGVPTQIKTKCETWFSETKQTDESAMPIVARNAFNFGGVRFDVLNDAGDFGEQRLIASKPSATEYLAAVGKETVLKFTSEPINAVAALKHFRRTVIYRNVRKSALAIP